MRASSPSRQPHRVQLRRTKGWRMPPDTVKVDRSTMWGNPFVIGRDGARDEVIEKFERYLLDSELVDELGELRGKVLGCWCSPRSCHGDVLLRLANA